jgi:transcriptional regulator with XRE-family HTH domain
LADSVRPGLEHVFVYSVDEVAAVLERGCLGQSLAQISRETGISRRTVERWLNGRIPGVGSGTRLAPTPAELVSSSNEAQYAYLLGLYLGDGHLAAMRRRVFRLYLTLDARYPSIIEQAVEAVGAVLSQNKVSVLPKSSVQAVNVCCYSKLWPILLPQHGPGRKHTRPICLHAWQRDITERRVPNLIRGLIHSDGCRYVARQRTRGRTYTYERYAFTNRSTDIIQIFCDHLDLLGVAWTMSTADQVQIAQREAVALLDAFIGPKC